MIDEEARLIVSDAYQIALFISPGLHWSAPDSVSPQCKPRDLRRAIWSQMIDEEARLIVSGAYQRTMDLLNIMEWF
jgi:hypothetical protein